MRGPEERVVTFSLKLCLLAIILLFFSNYNITIVSIANQEFFFHISGVN